MTAEDEGAAAGYGKPIGASSLWLFPLGGGSLAHSDIEGKSQRREAVPGRPGSLT